MNFRDAPAMRLSSAQLLSVHSRILAKPRLRHSAQHPSGGYPMIKARGFSPVAYKLLATRQNDRLVYGLIGLVTVIAVQLTQSWPF